MRNERVIAISDCWLRACSHGGGGPQVGEVPRFGGVTNLSIQSLFISWLRSHVKWGTSPRRVARSAEAGNPLSWGEFSPCECWRWGGVMFIRAIVSEFSTSVASFFADITFKTSTTMPLKKVLKELKVHLSSLITKLVYRSWMKVKSCP